MFHKGLLFSCVFIFSLVACNNSKGYSGKASKTSAAIVRTGAHTPQSKRAQTVVAKQLPKLRQEFKQAKLKLGAPIFIRIFKQEKKLEIWVQKNSKFVLFKTYPIAYYSGTLGPKFKEGDSQAPEGFYYVLPSQMNPNSRFHLSFNIGYPNQYDRAKQRTGSAIMVHGNTVSIGCFAMTDQLIEEIYTIADQALNAGQKFFRVHVFPFRMTAANMQRHAKSAHYQFWKNLQVGYLFFERTKQPPNVTVRNKQYQFGKDE